MARQDTFSMVAAGILVVMAILYFVAPRSHSGLGTAGRASAKAQISSFNTALNAYKRQTGAYPTTAEGLDVLVRNERDKNYLEQDVIPKDPWGRPYLYSSPGPKHPYEIVSMGADGRFGGIGEDADIYSWDLK